MDTSPGCGEWLVNHLISRRAPDWKGNFGMYVLNKDPSATNRISGNSGRGSSREDLTVFIRIDTYKYRSERVRPRRHAMVPRALVDVLPAFGMYRPSARPSRPSRPSRPGGAARPIAGRSGMTDVLSVPDHDAAVCHPADTIPVSLLTHNLGPGEPAQRCRLRHGHGPPTHLDLAASFEAAQRGVDAWSAELVYRGGTRAK